MDPITHSNQSQLSSQSNQTESASLISDSSAIDKMGISNKSRKIPVPNSFSNVDSSVLESLITEMISKISCHNDQIPVTQANLTRFHSRAPPGISIPDYIRRIIQFASVEKACLLILLIFIDRICEKHIAFTISSLTIHRFLIAAITVAAKSLCDSYCTNTHYARVGGISCQELNTLELEFLFLIDWGLYCDVNLLQSYYEHLVDSSENYIRENITS